MLPRSIPALVLAGGLCASASAATVVYTELFPNVTTGNTALSTAGWSAFSGAGAVDGSSATTAFVISNINGFDGSPGYGAKTSTTTVGLAFTGEFAPINRTLTEIDSISFANNNTNAGDLMRIAIRLDVANTPGATSDDLWYATVQTFTRNGGAGVNAPGTGNFLSNGVVQTLDFNTAAATWRSLSFTPGSTLVLGGTLGADLPAGNLTGAGIYNDANTATTRFDNFSISVVPEPTSASLVMLSLAGLAGARLRRIRG